MQLKKAVKSIVVPAMEREGFSLIETAPAYYEFKANDDSLRVVVCKGAWYPNALKVDVIYRNYSGRFSHFELDQLADYEKADLCYTNQEELEVCLIKIANRLESDVVLLLKNIRDNHIYLKKEMKELLSINPAQRAINYANRHSLIISYKLENFLFVENQVGIIRGDAIDQWRLRFDLYFEEIIDIISYYGELIRKGDSMAPQWDWGENDSYGLRYDQGWRYPQSDIISFWNYGLYIPMYRLVPISFRC